MTTKLRRKTQDLLIEMSSYSGKSFLEKVDEVREILEESPDVSTDELYLLQSICQVSQDLQILKEVLERYSSGFHNSTVGAKLSQLLEERALTFKILS